jgi:hypothetical protein
MMKAEAARETPMTQDRLYKNDYGTIITGASMGCMKLNSKKMDRRMRMAAEGLDSAGNSSFMA